MKTENQSSKPDPVAKQETGEGCPEAACSPSDSAYARFHKERRERLLTYIEDRAARHVADGGNDSPPYRKDCAYDGMRDLPGHSDRDIWNAAWEACLAQDPACGKKPWGAKIPSSWWKLSSDKFWEKVTNSSENSGPTKI
jgi:hypothetical protein